MKKFQRSKWTTAAPTLRDLIILCAQMREDEIEQWLALVDPEPFDFERAAVWCYELPGPKFSVFDSDGNLLVAGGAFPLQNGIMRSWMVGTQPAWDAHWRSITEVTKFVLECLIDSGVRRVETLALTKRRLTGRWYTKAIGLQEEGVMRCYGHGGEDVTVYSRVQPVTAPEPQVLEVCNG